MTGKQLKNSILQWAIQGKLVPQDPNDESVSVLLERIRAEKARLVKEKKIKKDKNESIIYRGEDNSYYEKFIATGEVKCIDEEIPFEIPATWEWCRLGYIFSHCTGKALNGTNRKGNLYTYITTSNLYWDRFELSSLKEMYFTEEELGKCTATKGDLLVCEGGDIGRSAIWNYDYNIRIQNHIHKLRSYIPLCTRFFYYVMYLYKGIGYIGGKGIGIQGLSSGALHNILIPTPSINEQKRIISQIEAIMPIAVKYEKSQEELNQLNDSIHNKLRKSILQEAIQGKLVPQITEEGTAKELLAKIRKEKEHLAKEGKLKKSALTDSVIFRGDDNKYFEKIDKIEKDITDEIPFEIPVEWNWCRLGCIASIKGGKRVPVGEKLTTENTGHVYIRVADMKQNSVTDNDIHYVSEAIFQKIKAYTISSDDLYITVAGTIGNVGEIPSTFNNANLTENANKIVFKFISKKFLMYCLLSDFVQSQIKSCTTKVGQPKLAIIRIENLLIPLPPLKEQYRIVAKIEQLASIMRG